jgi:NAD(P)-dependent dehydrogenase (short-subunit alcohol dehydrogenase family)
MEDLSGKTILVTGTSKGIGSEIARVLGNSGAKVQKKRLRRSQIIKKS